MVKSAEEIIKDTYTNPSSTGGFTGAEALYNAVHIAHPTISRKDVAKYLEKSRTYTLFKPSRTRFRRLRTVPSGFMTDVQADLADFQQLAEHNEGNKFLLLAVDVLSKKFFGVPVKSKSTTHMINAFEEIFTQMSMLPKRLYTDRGLEFESRKMKEFFAEKQIEKLAAQNVETKAAIAERGIRTVKNRIYKWFSEKNRMDWISVLPQVLQSINNTRSRTTGLAPNKVDERNAAQLMERIWGPDKERLEQKLKKGKKETQLIQKGDMVRRTEPRQIFDKGYFPRFSDMIYRVKTVHGTIPPRYTVVDWEGKGKELKKKLYQPQIVRLHRDADTSFRVDKVLRQRTWRGRKQFLVTYIGYPGQKSWINETDFF